MTPFSPGLAQGCFDLLEIASRSALTFPQIRSAFAYLGNIPTSKVLATAQVLTWLHSTDAGIVEISPTGARILGLSGYEPKLRQALLDYIDLERPPWIQNASFGRARVLAFAGSEITQVFVEAGLAHGTDSDVVSFWDALAARARGQKADRLTAIGRRGEQLTIAHEASRTNQQPKWISIENNEDGYDVLSVVSPTDERPLSIEVKTSTMGMLGSLHLTRNEWERAETTENHLFHLWSIQSELKSTLAVIKPEEMQSHVPRDQGSGSWECVEIAFSVFQTWFQSNEEPPSSGGLITSG